MGNTEKKLWRIEEVDDHWEQSGDGHYFSYPVTMELGIVEATEEEINDALGKDWNKPIPVGCYEDIIRPFEFTEIKVTHSLADIMNIVEERKVDNKLCDYGTGN